MLRCALTPAMLALLLTVSAVSADTTPPHGLWLDATGQGAVEIKDCGGKLCGKVVWLKSARNADRCSAPILGDLAALGDGRWGGGWIYDPESKAKFSVEITPQGADRLQVLGYLRSKAFGRIMTWTKAPDGLARCDEAAPPIVTAEAAAAAAPAPVKLVPLQPRAAATQPDPAPGQAAVGTIASENVEPGTPVAGATARHAAAVPARSARSGMRKHASSETASRTTVMRLASLGPYGLQDVTLRKSRGSCRLKISDFGRVAFPC